MSNTVTFTPSEPITYNEKPYPVLSLRKMKAKDLVAGDLVDGDTRKSLAILASMAGVPIGVIEELDVDDFERLSDVAVPLMGKSAKAAMEAAKAGK